MSGSHRKIEIDYKVLDALMQFRVTLEFVADYLGVSEDTVRRRIKEDFNKTFTEYNQLKMQRTAVKLQQKAIEVALQGKNAAVLIFALKNIANWTDKIDQALSTEIAINIQKQDEAL